jgi:ubiquinone/menaquinone biosynthesis C-methylase UbiE
MTQSAFDTNAEAIEAWNTVLFDKFSRFRAPMTTGLAIHGDAELERHPVKPGQRVLDIGCGFGDTTVEIARRVGPAGLAVGIDAAARFIELATLDAQTSKVTNAKFRSGDAQTADLGGPYDRAFSRFGTMFFASPVAALRNVRRSLVPGGLLTMVVWRSKAENPFLSEAEQRVLEIVPHPEKGDQVTCGPGPFSMASPDVVSAQLLRAGFERPCFERFDADICLGDTVDEALDLGMEIGPAGEVLRLAGDDAEKYRADVVRTLRELYAEYATDDGVKGRSSSWIVSAYAPKEPGN